MGARKLYYFLPEVATKCRVSIHTVRYWLKTGRLRRAKFGRRVMVPYRSLERLMAEARNR